jgi:hypothetical protein
LPGAVIAKRRSVVVVMEVGHDSSPERVSPPLFNLIRAELSTCLTGL